MKVKVKIKHAPLNQVEHFLNEALSEALADLDAAHREIERLFQENKDLRVREGHTQDELKQLKSRFATACAERDNWEASFKQMTSWWEQAVDTKTKAEQELNSTQVELADRNERVFILEQRIEMLKQENEEWRNTAEQLSTKVSNQNDEINRVTGEAYDLDQKNLELEMTVTELNNAIDALKEENAKYRATVTWAKLNAAQEEITRLQEEVARLTTERDTAVRENTTLIFRNSELEDELEAAVNLKNDYAEQVDALRKERNALSRKANDTTASFWNFLVEHGLVKTEEELGGNHNEA